MIRACWNLVVMGLLFAITVLLVGCGSGTGGASKTNITIGGLSSTNIEAGTNVSGTIKITADSLALNHVTVTVKTDNPFVTGSANATDGAGNATFILYASSGSDFSKPVKVWAEYNGISSNNLEINLKSFTESSALTFTMLPSVTYARTVDTGTAAGLYSTNVTGNQVLFKAANGAVVTVPVEISVDSITGYAAGDVITVTDTTGYIYFEGIKPLTLAAFSINSVDGTVTIPTIYTYILPAASSTAGVTTAHTYAVVWRAKVVYNGMVYYKTAEVSVSASTTSKAPAP